MILAMHGIIRADPMVVAQKALDTIRGGIMSHGGDVELDSISDGVAYVRLQGACNGCSMAAVTMRDGVEKALVEGVPGVTSVEVLPNDPAAAKQTLIPLSEIGFGYPSSGSPLIGLDGICRVRMVREFQHR
jgi:Fe-S cluster biogenesis protein NfuA